MTELKEIYLFFARLFHVELVALLLSLPRLYAFINTSQLLSTSAVPQLPRTACILSLSVISVPINMPHAAQFDGSFVTFALLFAKEYALGFVMGYLVGWIFWSVQAAGALIDNQRGAAIASSIDPMQGHEASPLGIMFSHVFITYVFVTGAMLPIFGLLYQSFVLWPVTRFIPVISPDFPVFMLAVMDHATRFVVILAGPVVAIMFLAEFALAMVSRFAPQVQVFVLAMPIKSLLALFMLIFYFATLIRYSESNIHIMHRYADYFYNMIPPAAPGPER
ncbi:MAG: type III secretion system export apparatus subunit SctT [Pseudochelatococcus sp.]|jgi:type III secretion protein T|uniref:type III secretion system export apparatus subunit SctT n=1 Tax=Pseudochelatococcus sp. TaxID=2020869 RepID=UPI003D90AE35